MEDKTTVNTTSATAKPAGKAARKSGTKARGTKKARVKRTKKQMADSKEAFIRIQQLLEMERAREGRSDVLIDEFERIEAELKETIFQDALSL